MVEAADPSREVPLEVLLGDIDNLRPHLVSRRSDLDAERYEGRHNIYAVDTNVLYFCAQPLAYVKAADDGDPGKTLSWRRGSRPSFPTMIDLGSVFRSDPLELHGVVCTALARYIGLKLGDTPLYIPLAIEPEIAGMYAHFARFTEELSDFEGMLLAPMKERLSEIVDQLSADHFAAIQSELPSLIESLTRLINVRAGPASGMVRLNQIYDVGRLSNLSWINPAKLTRRSYGSFSELGFDHSRALEALSDAWEKDLIFAGKVDAGTRQSDAMALAEIEFWNNSASVNESRERLLYLTADKLVHLAAARRMLGKRSFADLYIRHPSAFLEDIIVAARPATSDVQNQTPPTSLLDWIDVLISGYVKKNASAMSSGSVLDTKAREVIRIFGIEHPTESGKVRSGWHSLADLREGRLLDELGLSEWLDTLVGKIAAAGDNLSVQQLRNELRGLVLAEEAQAWESCFNIAAELTLKLDQRHIDRASRSSPPICFEGWPGAGEAVEQFKFWGYNEVFDQDAFEIAKTKLQESDETRYAYYLAFASLFAGRGNWNAAAALSSFAVELAQFSGRAIGRGANGREAAFLEAVARRHTATSPRQLDRSIEALSTCNAILVWETENQNVAPERIVSDRFELEQLDISQTRLLFELRQLPEQPLDDDQKAVAVGLIDRYGDVQTRLQRYLLRERGISKQLPLQLGSRSNVLLQTELRSIVSACSLFALGLEREPAAFATASRLIARIDEIDRLAVDGKSPRNLRLIDTSFLGTTVIGVSRILLARAAPRRDERATSERIRELRRLLSKKNIKQYSLFPFDQRRFDYMRWLLE